MVHMWLSCSQYTHFTDEETGVTGWPEFSQPGSGEWQENGPEWPTLLATPGPRLTTPGHAWPYLGLCCALSEASPPWSQNLLIRHAARRSLCTLYLQEEPCEQISRVTREMFGFRGWELEPSVPMC